MAMPAVEADAELARRFDELARQWRRETQGLSNSEVILEHPAYLEILEMGAAVVPLILRDLAAGGGFWISALTELTGADPAPAAERGRSAKMREAWLAWGRARGLIE